MTPARPSLATLLLTGMRGCCPRCGRGRLFSRFLVVADRCSACGLGFAGHDAGDAPAFAGICILGAVVVPLAFLVERLFLPPLWVHALLWTPTVLGGTLALLRPIKGMTVALQYRYRSLDEPDGGKPS